MIHMTTDKVAMNKNDKKVTTITVLAMTTVVEETASAAQRSTLIPSQTDGAYIPAKTVDGVGETLLCTLVCSVMLTRIEVSTSSKHKI